MQQMELREQLEQAQQQQDQALLTQLNSQVQKSYQENIKTLSDSIEQQDWNSTKQTIDRLKFIRKLQQEIERLEEKLFDF